MYYCKYCGMPFENENVAFCSNCGAPKGEGNNYCWNCGQQTYPNANVCTCCGVNLGNTRMPAADQKSKLAAGLLGIFLGGLGIHNFYLGYMSKGIIQLVMSIVGAVFTCLIFGAFIVAAAEIWGFIEGILILAGSISTDANGVPLKN